MVSEEIMAPLRVMPRDRNQVPDGQPEPYPRVRVTKHPKHGDLPEHVYPHQVVDIEAKKELEPILEEYAHPFPMMGGSNDIKSKASMRYLIEWVYPALRWFCRIYDHPIPKWLEGNGWADGMSRSDHEEYFGREPLHVEEWQERKETAGKRA